MTTPVGAQAAALGPRRRSPCLATAADASARLRKCPAEAGLVEDMVQACRTSRPTKRDATETRDMGPANPQNQRRAAGLVSASEIRQWVWGGSALRHCPGVTIWGIAGLPALMKCR